MVTSLSTREYDSRVGLLGGNFPHDADTSPEPGTRASRRFLRGVAVDRIGRVQIGAKLMAAHAGVSFDLQYVMPGHVPGLAHLLHVLRRAPEDRRQL